jgi:phosphoglycolate/pyridoxal phosphate phosphatase family enzyme
MLLLHYLLGSLLLFLQSCYPSLAWSSKHPLFSRGKSPLFSSKPDDFVGSEALYTSADITDTIRKESVMEMKKVTEMLNSSCPESRRPHLIETNGDFRSYVHSNSIENFLFDCDGVLYRGTDPMPCASQTIQQLINRGKKVFFVTNNAASTRMELKLKLEKVLNCKGVLKEEMMIGSAYVAGQYLKSCKLKEHGNKNRVHVIGTSGLCSELQSAGFDVSGGQDPVDTPSGMSRDELAAYPFPEGEIDALVIGLDNDFNYRKLCIATVLLQRNPDALLIATNLDAFDLVGFDARHLPGNGALVAAVEMASGRTAINVGKPSSTLSELIMDVYGLKAQETLMVGDRLDTDIKFGNDSGMKSALVLTGCATSSDIQSVLKDDVNSQMIPNVIFPHVGYMFDDANN